MSFPVSRTGAPGESPTLPPEIGRREIEDPLLRLREARSSLEHRLGRGLRLLRDRLFDPIDLGHTGLGALARNELGISGPQACELCYLADALDRFPALERAWRRGEVVSDQVLKLRDPRLRRGYPDRTRHRAGVGGRARSMSVHETRLAVKAWRRLKKGEHLGEEGEDSVEVVLRGRPKEVHFVKIVGRDMVERVVGHPLPMWRAADCLCAELSSEFGDQMPRDWKPDEEEPEAARALEGIEVPDEEGLRENCRCAFPGCARRWGEGHHRKHHSHGGCDELWNLMEQAVPGRFWHIHCSSQGRTRSARRSRLEGKSMRRTNGNAQHASLLRRPLAFPARLGGGRQSGPG